MRIILNGWQRLWLVTSLVLAVACITLGVLALPGDASITHNSKFESALSAEAQAQIAGTNDEVGTTVRMPNGHQIALKSGIDAKRSTAAIAEYASELRRQLGVKRRAFVLSLFALWVALSLAIYLLGWSVGWIRRGFSSKGKAP